MPQGPFLVVGLGKAGRAAAQALAEHAGPAAVRVWTDYESEGVRAARGCLAALGVKTSVGSPGTALDLDPPPRCVVKSPGLPMSHPVLAAASLREIPVVDELELGWRLGVAPVIGVTGTDGKGTVTHLIAHCLRAGGDEAICTGNRLVEPAFSAASEPSDGWVVCEVSSYQLEATTDFLPEAGVFTNLTHDHLHRHGGMAAYGDCKRRMFLLGERCVRLAVINADDGFGVELGVQVARRGGRVVSFGTDPSADYRVSEATWGLDHARIHINARGAPLTVESQLPGPHNAANVAATLAAVEALGVSQDTALEALAGAEPVPGRLQRIAAGQPFEAIVDYAHTPNAVAQALLTIRRVLSDRGGGRLLAVVGVVGGSDPTKRAPIGRVARRMADVAVLTSGAPGRESPEAIAAGLADGARSTAGGAYEVEPDRRRAIERAVELARPGDFVVVLGRGSMRRMRVTRTGEEVAFDDREVLREALLQRCADTPS